MVGVADHLRDIKPVKAPAFIKRKEIAEIARLVPIVLLERVALDLGHPVDQLASIAIEIVDNRVDNDLAGQDGAHPHIRVAVEDRLAPRHAAPRIDAGKRDPVGGVELSAERRVDALAVDHNVGAHAVTFAAAAGFEVHGCSAPVLLCASALVISANGVGAQTRQRRPIQDHVKTAAMDADFRIFVARQLPARFLVNELAEAVVETALPVLDTGLE